VDGTLQTHCLLKTKEGKYDDDLQIPVAMQQ